MEFRLIRPGEEEIVLKLYRSVIGRKFCTWDQEYPGMFEIERDMAQDDLFVLTDGDEIIGSIAIDPENEMDKDPVWRHQQKAAEFARVVIAIDHQGKGLAGIMVRNVLNVMKERGYEAVHISVAKINIPAQKTYRSAGFEFVGERFMYGYDFYLCEKLLT